MPGVQVLARMTARDPEEAHRASTPLELFFDLTFVVAIAQLAATAHHQLVDGHAGDALTRYPLSFFAIWWAWMNFTWFASAFDVDDAVYRLATLVQMAGVVVLAAGIPRFLVDGDIGIVLLGYVIMRVALVGLWLRAAVQHPAARPCALRYAGGVFVCQVGWVVVYFGAGDWWAWATLALVACEMSVPVIAERDVRTTWHPGHIAERYGLFTIIVLGESVLSATVAIQVALDGGERFADLAPVSVGGILIVAAMWWIYFDIPVDRVLDRARRGFASNDRWQAFVWGYGHAVVFASIAATGAGIAVAADQAIGHSALSDVEAGLAVTVPVAGYLLSVWALHARYKDPGPMKVLAAPIGAALVVAASWTGEPVLVAGLVVAALVGASLRPASR